MTLQCHEWLHKTVRFLTDNIAAMVAINITTQARLRTSHLHAAFNVQSLQHRFLGFITTLIIRLHHFTLFPQPDIYTSRTAATPHWQTRLDIITLDNTVEQYFFAGLAPLISICRVYRADYERYLEFCKQFYFVPLNILCVNLLHS